MTVTFASMCSGIGAPEVAWHDGLGWQSKFVAEIEPHPCRVLKKRWPGVPNLGDMTTINGAEWELDVLVAGTPCQSFSFAGLRQGLNDDRGNLTFTYVKVTHAIRHLFASVWENVPGVLSDETNAFGYLLGGLVGADGPVLPCKPPPSGKSTDFWRWIIPDAESGKQPFHCPSWPDAGMVAGPLGRAAWRILDAQYFGLAQRRRRVFVVFCPAARGGDPSAILFERKGVSGHPKTRRKAREDVAGTLTSRATGGGGGPGAGTDEAASGYLQAVSEEISPSLRAQAQASSNGWGVNEKTAYTLDGANGQAICTGRDETPIYFDCKASGQNGFGVSHIPGPLPAMGRSGSHQNGGGHAAVAYSIMPQNSGKDFKARQIETAQPLMAGGPTTGNQGGDVIMSHMRVRRLTPTECARLQGFPDTHSDVGTPEKPSPDGPMYKSYGNSMATKVMKWLGVRIEADMKRADLISHFNA